MSDRMDISPPAVKARQLTFYESLGSGSFGKVYRAYDSSLGKSVAVKMIEMDTSSEIDETLIELNILRDLRSEYITQYYGALLHGSVLCISMEYCAAGACSTMIKTYTSFKEDSAAYVLNGILNALVYIHGQKKIHRDLKSANILVTEDCRVKVADFGVGAQLSHTTPVRNSFMGTPYWMAPEVIQTADYSTSVDIWSLGIIGFELVTGMPPHRRLQPTEAMMRISQDPAPRLPALTNHPISQEFRQLIESCLSKDPRKRPTARELLDTRIMRNSCSPPRSFRTMVASTLGARDLKYRNAQPRTLSDIDGLAPLKTRRSRLSPQELDDDDEFELSVAPNRPPSPKASLTGRLNQIHIGGRCAELPMNPARRVQSALEPRLPLRRQQQRQEQHPQLNPQLNPQHNPQHYQHQQLCGIPTKSPSVDQNLPNILRDDFGKIDTKKIVRDAFEGVVRRTKAPGAIPHIERLLAEFEQMNRDYPGFSRALVQEMWRSILTNWLPNQS